MELRVDPGKTRRLVQEIFEHSGLSEEEAFTVSENLILAEMRGIRSHGLVQVENYSQKMREGKINPRSKITLLREGKGNAVFDADHAPGSVAGKFAMRHTIRKARQNGVAVSTVRNGTHFGYAAYYAMQALDDDMIGLAFTSTGAAVAPFGGYERLVGTNPICVAVPAGKARPVVFDAATSNVAFNKAFFAYTEGRSIPDDWGLDADGKATTNPADIVTGGGALLPFGGYKGYGLGFIVFIITTLLSGTSVLEDCKETAAENYMKVSYNFAAIDISQFTDIAEFKRNLDISVERIKSSKRIAGIDEIFVPGEIESNNYVKSQREGLILYDGVSNSISRTLAELGIPMSLSDCFFKKDF